jgi:hypothetical protein
MCSTFSYAEGTNRVLRRIYGPKRNDITGEWRRICNEELNDLYCPPNIIRLNTSKRMRWEGHAARRAGGEVHAGYL